MIKSFIHKGLRELFETGRSSKVPSEMRKRIVNRLDALQAARALPDLDQPGFNCHPLKPSVRHAISVSGAWRITFEWIGNDAHRVDLEQYH